MSTLAYTTYTDNLKRYSQLTQELKNKIKFLGLVRLICIIMAFVLLYLEIKGVVGAWIGAVTALILFFYLVSQYFKTSKALDIAKTHLIINKKELDFLDRKEYPAEDGAIYSDAKHPYTGDLDIFGQGSVYHYVNRTATYQGGQRLAQWFSIGKSKSQILDTQEAVKELTDGHQWRGDYQVFAILSEDSKSINETVNRWINNNTGIPGPWIRAYAIVIPILFAIALGAYLILDSELAKLISIAFFLMNLGGLFCIVKGLKKQLSVDAQFSKTLAHYSRLLHLMESRAFTSKKLLTLQSQIQMDGSLASSQLHVLSKTMAQIDNITNPMASIIMNGTIQYHVHKYIQLQDWRKQYGQAILTWIDAIAEVEALNSLAQLSYNHPHYTYPILNDDKKIKFKGLGHPLIDPEDIVTNDVSFTDHRFIILTGSNMSGKSTFLRSLGVNMVLTNMGAPICAVEAIIHPMDILVSMRLSDSLNDNESYFLAEVKRLKFIMDSCQEKPVFVLLDEILRGTNSEDKRHGTIEVIKKLIQYPVYGTLATHDLQVCDISSQYPEKITNCTFEAEMKDGQLTFDYLLRDGICKNKSATYIMKQYEVID